MLLQQPTLTVPPTRIISLVPSITELLYTLDLETETVGVTKFCIHPEHWFRNKTRVGGTKNLNIEKIRSLQPDLIIANKEENVKEQVMALVEEFPVWLTDVNSYDEALQMIGDIGKLTSREQLLNDLLHRIEQNAADFKYQDRIPAAYLIWKDPYMTVGGYTFIHSMMDKCGFDNVFQHQHRYPEVTVDDIRRSNATHLLLSSEPYPFKQQHIDELQQLLPEMKILLVDGEYFSWYGSRMGFAFKYFMELRAEINL